VGLVGFGFVIARYAAETNATASSVAFGVALAALGCVTLAVGIGDPRSTEQLHRCRGGLRGDRGGELGARRSVPSPGFEWGIPPPVGEGPVRASATRCEQPCCG
jgi:hypothetical protein